MTTWPLCYWTMKVVHKRTLLERLLLLLIKDDQYVSVIWRSGNLVDVAINGKKNKQYIVVFLNIISLPRFLGIFQCLFYTRQKTYFFCTYKFVLMFNASDSPLHRARLVAWALLQEILILINVQGNYFSQISFRNIIILLCYFMIFKNNDKMGFMFNTRSQYAVFSVS